MLKFSKKLEYALMAILYMAQKRPGELTTARELSLRFNIPSELMSKVLQTLTRKFMLKSIQGAKGGYWLERSLEKILVSEVISALEGPIAVTACMKPEPCPPPKCEQKNYCNLKGPMLVVQNKLADLFSNLTLQDLEEKSGAAREQKGKPNG